MPSPLGEQIAAPLDRLDDVDASERTSGPSADSLLLGENDRRPPELLHQPGSDQTEHAVRPALAASDDDAPLLPAGLRSDGCDRLLGDCLRSLAALLV